MTIAYERWQGSMAEAAEPLLALCRTVFPDFSDAYLLDRLPRLADPVLWIAVEQGRCKGFKLGYRRGADILYSWLGGVAAEVRGQGVASELMRLQHAQAAADSYGFVETRTRATNNPMILLNLRHGFFIAGYETDARGVAVVTQRKALNPKA